MDLFKKPVSNLKESKRYTSPDEVKPSQRSLNIPVAEKSRQSHSFCEYDGPNIPKDPQEMNMSPNKSGDREFRHSLSANDRNASNRRLSIKLQDVPKADHQEKDLEEPVKTKEEVKSIPTEKDEKETKKTQEKERKKDLVKKDVQKVRGNKQKKSIVAKGAEFFKNAFYNRKKKKSFTENKNASFKKTRTGDDWEVDELDGEDRNQINQINRNFEKKTVGSLKIDSEEIAEEGNPISTGINRISMSASIKINKEKISILPKAVGETQIKQDDRNGMQVLPELKITSEFHKSESLENVTTPRKKYLDAKFTRFRSLFNKMSKIQRRPFLKNVIDPSVNISKRIICLSVAAVLYAAVIYGIVPFGLLFAAHDYGNNEYVQIFANFGVLGLLHGVLEILLVIHLVDRPILKRIKDIEGEDGIAINSQEFVIINGIKPIVILILRTGLQIIAGGVIYKLEYKINIYTTLLSLISSSGLGLAFWFLVMLFQSPTETQSRKKTLKKQLERINDIHKKFIEKLQKTKQELYNPNEALKNKFQINSEVGNKERQILNPAIMGIVCTAQKNVTKGSPDPAGVGVAAAIQMNVEVDIKNFRNSTNKYSGDLFKMRISILSVYLLILLCFAQLLALFEILKVIYDHFPDDAAVSLPLLLGITFIGTIFGYLNFSRPPNPPVLSTTKILSLIITLGAYRFFYFVVDKEMIMVGAVIMKCVYKVSQSYIPLLGYKRAISFWKQTKKHCLKQKEEPVEHYLTLEEREIAEQKPLRYIFQKFTIIQDVDLYFGLGTLVTLVASRDWFDMLEFDLSFILDKFNFYIGFALIEAGFDLILWIHFAGMVQRAFHRETLSKKLNIVEEIQNVIKNRKAIIFVCKVLTMFLFLFIFLNKDSKCHHKDGDIGYICAK